MNQITGGQLFLQRIVQVSPCFFQRVYCLAIALFIVAIMFYIAHLVILNIMALSKERCGWLVFIIAYIFLAIAITLIFISADRIINVHWYAFELMRASVP